MWQNLRVIKSILWLVVVLACLALILSLGLRELGAEAPLNDALDATPESSSPESVVPVLPQILIYQSKDRLQASASSEVTEWQYVGPSLKATCDLPFFTTTTQTIRSGREVLLDTTDYGRYYCFRALVASDNYIYHAYLVAYERAELMIEQDFNALNERVLRAETLQTVINWQITGPLSENKCSSATFAAAAEQGELQESNEITIDNDESWQDLDSQNLPVLYYCFRAQNAGQQWGLASRRLSFDSLNFFWRTSDDELLVVVENLSQDLLGEYVVQDSAASSCSMEDFVEPQQVESGNSIDLSDVDGQRRYCFRIKDAANTYHYDDYLLN